MLYLLYLKGGFIKKYPLKKKTVTIGRSTRNDLVLRESFVSQEHARLTVTDRTVMVEDLNSTNGLFIDDRRVDRAEIAINRSFRIGYYTLFLKEGNERDFVLSEKVQPVLKKISTVMSSENDKTQTAIKLLYTEPLIELLQIGFSLDEFADIFQYARDILDKSLKHGTLILITREQDNTIIESRWNYNENDYAHVFTILQNTDLFDQPRINQTIEDGRHYCTFPFPSGHRSLLLLYLAEDKKPVPRSIVGFLKDLSVEIAIIDSLIQQNKPVRELDTSIQAGIITRNSHMLNLLAKCKKIGASDLFVMIEGETGTGKELLARYIHNTSNRVGRDFVAVNCAAIPETLMEDELFGHEKGAFTDAKERRIGKLELSSGGTLVLDEIGDMPLSLQKKLLRVIQEGEFYRIGGNQPITIDLRLISLSNRDIQKLVEQNLFRQDLYYRINHVSLRILPLRERKDDIVPLINHFVKSFGRKPGVTLAGFSKEAMTALEKYDWPGNVRELENEIRKLVSLAEQNEMIDISMLKSEISQNYRRAPQPDTEKIIHDEKTVIEQLLRKHRWNKSRVADELGISRTALYKKLRKFAIH